MEVRWLPLRSSSLATDTRATAGCHFLSQHLPVSRLQACCVCAMCADFSYRPQIMNVFAVKVQCRVYTSMCSRGLSETFDLIALSLCRFEKYWAWEFHDFGNLKHLVGGVSSLCATAPFTSRLSCLDTWRSGRSDGAIYLFCDPMPSRRGRNMRRYAVFNLPL